MNDKDVKSRSSYLFFLKQKDVTALSVLNVAPDLQKIKTYSITRVNSKTKTETEMRLLHSLLFSLNSIHVCRHKKYFIYMPLFSYLRLNIFGNKYQISKGVGDEISKIVARNNSLTIVPYPFWKKSYKKAREEAKKVFKSDYVI